MNCWRQHGRGVLLLLPGGRQPCGRDSAAGRSHQRGAKSPSRRENSRHAPAHRLAIIRLGLVSPLRITGCKRAAPGPPRRCGGRVERPPTRRPALEKATRGRRRPPSMPGRLAASLAARPAWAGCLSCACRGVPGPFSLPDPLYSSTGVIPAGKRAQRAAETGREFRERSRSAVATRDAEPD